MLIYTSINNNITTYMTNNSCKPCGELVQLVTEYNLESQVPRGRGTREGENEALGLLRNYNLKKTLSQPFYILSTLIIKV